MTAFQDVDKAAIADPEVQLRGIAFPKNFKELTRDRLEMNARLEPKKDPHGPGDRGEAQGSRLDQHGQAAPERGDHVPSELHGAEHRSRPQGARRGGIDLIFAGEPGGQFRTAQDACSSCLLRPLGLTYKLEDEVVLITSPQADQAQTYPQDVLCRRPGDAAGSRPAEPDCRTRCWNPNRRRGVPKPT